MPLSTHVLNMLCSMVAGGGVCCWLNWLMGGGWSTVVAAAADRPPLLAPGSLGVGWCGHAAGCGWPFPSILHPSWSPRGEGERWPANQAVEETLSHNLSLGRLAGNWKAGGELRRLMGNWKLYRVKDSIVFSLFRKDSLCTVYSCKLKLLCNCGGHNAVYKSTLIFKCPCNVVWFGNLPPPFILLTI